MPAVQPQGDRTGWNGKISMDICTIILHNYVNMYGKHFFNGMVWG